MLSPKSQTYDRLHHVSGPWTVLVIEANKLKRRSGRIIFWVLLGVFVSLGAPSVPVYLVAQQKKLDGYQRGLAHSMLKNILNDVKKHYYDPTFHGVDLDGRFREADRKIDEATSFNRVFVLISWALEVLHDSHTYFVVPPRPSRYEYGWQMQPVGTRCLVTAVKPGTDAERKGVRPGDEVVSLDGFALTRDTFHGLRQLFGELVPQDSLTVSLRGADRSTRNLNIQAEVQNYPKEMTVWGENIRDLPKRIDAWATEHLSRSKAVGTDLMVWKMSLFLSDEDVSKEFDEVKKFKSLILDMRGNSGGNSEVLARTVGGLFDHDVKIGDRETRSGRVDWTAKTRGSKAFTGRLIVLIDSQTASAAEILARLVQIEKRGTIIGDKTAGMVRESRFYSYRSSPDRTQIVIYGAAVTEADLVMSDGNSLEGVGVTPDETRLAAPEDLAAQRDPVLARAAEVLGVSLTPEEAGGLFPVTWETPKRE